MINPGLFENTETAFRHLSDRDVRRAHFLFSVVNHPWVSSVATGFLRWCLKLRLPIDGLIRATIFRQFCGGETIRESAAVIERNGSLRVRTILDYSVEGENSEVDFEGTCSAVLETMEEAVGSAHVPFCVFKMTGLGDGELLARIQAGSVLSEPEQAAFRRIRSRVDRICDRAREAGIPVLIDAEETWIQDPIDALAAEMMARYNQEKALVFTTIQMYRKDGLAKLHQGLKAAQEGNYHFGVKMVRGAYMEKERERAIRMDRPDPIQPDKAATDRAFDEGLRFCVAHLDRISLVCGSHNESSNLLLVNLLQEHRIGQADGRVWFSQLLGMSDNISFNLAREGFNVVKYVPYGPVRSVIPYLIRRAEENTSVAGQSSRELRLIRQELKRRRKIRA